MGNNKQNKRATDRAIRMKNEDTTTQEKERFNYDNTIIGETAWGALKHRAIQDNYESQAWYRDLPSYGKDDIRACREAQIKQGDDGPLLIEPSKYYLGFVWPDGV